MCFLITNNYTFKKSDILDPVCEMGVMLILQSKIINEVRSTIKLSEACHTTKLKKNVHDSAPQ